MSKTELCLIWKVYTESTDFDAHSMRTGLWRSWVPWKGISGMPHSVDSCGPPGGHQILRNLLKRENGPCLYQGSFSLPQDRNLTCIIWKILSLMQKNQKTQKYGFLQLLITQRGVQLLLTYNNMERKRCLFPHNTAGVKTKCTFTCKVYTVKADFDAHSMRTGLWRSWVPWNGISGMPHSVDSRVLYEELKSFEICW